MSELGRVQDERAIHAEADAPAPHGPDAWPGTAPAAIRTPDQRVRVFVSSTLQELAPERLAVRAAITQLRLSPVLFELGARPHPPRDLYRAYLAQSDIFIGIYWERYGWVAPAMDISGLEDEYRLSGPKPKLIYVKTPAPHREPGLETLLHRIQAEDNVSYKPFATPDELRELIENDLALLLTERFAQAEAAASASHQPAAPWPTSLPVQRHRAIGREPELAAARALLQRDEVGLLTLTGPGGIGKTCLAVQVATELLDHFAGRVFVVSLAAITDPTLVASAIAQPLNVQAMGGRSVLDSLKAVLRGLRLLLVLDNFEQVIQAAPLVGELLATCPQLKVLATSRAPLHVRGEKELAVPPLALPDPVRVPPVESLSHYAAVALFVERAHDVQPGFVLTADTAPAVVEICRRLDGLPLAIELAAARLKVLPPEALLARLERRLPLLTGGAQDSPARQRTLRTTIAWSYDLLNDGERALFRHLAVFAGGCTLTSAESVAGSDATAEDDMLEGLGSLVDKSLLQVRAEPGGEPRFTMLETIREFAREMLETSGEEAAIRERHARHIVALVEEIAPRLWGPEQVQWLARLAVEQDNVRAALRTLLDAGELAAVGRLLRSLAYYWWMHGLLREARRWAEEALALGAGSSPAVQACARFVVGLAAMDQGDETAAAHCQEARALAHAGGDRWVEGHSLLLEAFQLPARGDLDRGIAQLWEAQQVLREAGDDWGVGFSWTALSALSVVAGRLDDAERCAEEHLAVARRMGDLRSIAQAQESLAAVALMREDVDRASALLHESIVLAMEVGHVELVAHMMMDLAVVAAHTQPVHAACLFGAAEALREAVGVGIWPPRQKLYDQALAMGRDALGAAEFTAAWAEGRAMSLERAVEYALGTC
jgi:predicted ATPase